jgi:hypothetical protein
VLAELTSVAVTGGPLPGGLPTLRGTRGGSWKFFHHLPGSSCGAQTQCDPPASLCQNIGVSAKPGWWESHRNLGMRETVIATLLGGVVLAAILGLFGKIPVWDWLVLAQRWLVHPVPIPLVVLMILVGIIGVFALAFLLSVDNPPPLPPWLDYREDTIFGIVWRWRYDDTERKQLVESSIAPYCTKCDILLRGAPGFYAPITTSFICDECQFKRDIPGDGPAVARRLVSLIDDRARQRRASAAP